jgi:predicted regulator of Ras-like GTPase activity (Roadblock/LC7/MglB family)
MKEVLAMRRLLFLLTLVLAACGGNGDGSRLTQEPVQHLPEILNLTLSPDSALQMEGDGSVVVTAEITFSDAGRDIETMWVRMPDSATMEFDEAINIEMGTLTEDFAVPTNQVGAFLIEIWLVDKAGDSSAHRVANFSVIDDGQPGDWRSRLSGLPYSLNDVLWDGSIFIAVGDGGTVLTSVDGIDWVASDSGTDADLFAVAAHDSDIFAVGEDIVLQSTNHGETWITKNEPVAVILVAVAANSSQVVVGGRTDSLEPFIMISEDGGDSWRVIDSWPDQFLLLNDFIAREGLFIAAADSLFSHDGGWVFVSPDGVVWNEVFRDAESGFVTIVDDGSRITVAGVNGAAITSLDGLNWTDMQTPVEGADYLSGASNGSRLVLAGGYACESIPCWPPPELPVGIATTDDGLSWDVFNIGGEYESYGLAFGNGRFVSVGQSAWASDEGAIYTTD